MRGMSKEQWMVRLYQREMRYRYVRDLGAPPVVINTERRMLRKGWDEAKTIGLTEEDLSRHANQVWIHVVDTELLAGFMTECFEHRKRQMYEEKHPKATHFVCAYAQRMDGCSPFCPHYRKLTEAEERE